MSIVQKLDSAVCQVLLLLTALFVILCFCSSVVYSYEIIDTEHPIDGLYVVNKKLSGVANSGYSVESVKVHGGKIVARKLLMPYTGTRVGIVSPNSRALAYVNSSNGKVVEFSLYDTNTAVTRSFSVHDRSPNFGFWSPDGNIFSVYGYQNKEHTINFVSLTFPEMQTIRSGEGRWFRSLHWINADNSVVYSTHNFLLEASRDVLYFRASFPKVKGKQVMKIQQISRPTAQKLTGKGVEQVIHLYERDSSSLSMAATSYPISPKYEIGRAHV